MIRVIECSFSYLCKELMEYELEGADCILEIETAKIGLLESSKVDELYKIGYETTKKRMKEIVYSCC